MKTTASKRNALPHSLAGAVLVSLALMAFVSGCNSSFRMGSLQGGQPVTSPPTNQPPTPSQSGAISISPAVAALAPGQTQQFQATVAGSGGQVVWLVNGVAGGNATVGTISANGLYTAPASITLSENVIVTAELSGSAQQNYATAVVSILSAATVTCPFQLGNPLVAEYGLDLPAPGSMLVEFGPTTSYGLDTWNQPTPTVNGQNNGGDVQIYVAGMRATTTYHMRALVTLDDGATYQDADHQCVTGSLASANVAPISPVLAATTSGATPQSGVEMWNTLVPPSNTQVFATDLQGNVIWE